MPHKHSIKKYVKNGFYHVYNRGVNKMEIYSDDHDYRIFLHLLKYYLSPTSENQPLKKFDRYVQVRIRPLANVSKEVDLVCYCLMPNHFHLLLRQNTKDGMAKLMRRLLTTYAIYFNKKNQRVGHLFQGTYKGALIETDSYLIHLVNYIHQNSNELKGVSYKQYPYSSYPYFVGQKKCCMDKTKNTPKIAS